MNTFSVSFDALDTGWYFIPGIGYLGSAVSLIRTVTALFSLCLV